MTSSPWVRTVRFSSKEASTSSRPRAGTFRASASRLALAGAASTWSSTRQSHSSPRDLRPRPRTQMASNRRRMRRYGCTTLERSGGSASPALCYSSPSALDLNPFDVSHNLPTTSSYVFTEVELKHERTDVWLTWWASTDGAEASGRLGYWLGIYGALGVIEVSAMAGVVLWVAKQGRRNTACIPR